jgi:hypothetical protein
MERDHLKDPEIEETIILRRIFRSGMDMDWINVAQNRQVVGTCKCSNEPLGSAKCREFLDQLRTDWCLKKDSAPWSE